MDEELHKPRKFAGPRLDIEAIKNQMAVLNNAPSPGPGGLTKPSKAQGHCLCSPTTHAGSFRCRHHRNAGLAQSIMSYGG
ncbi:unnamed protein product [Ilex paraguariensis]|uniref:Uncharacterized protein n=1 Tax=Ilex paraguariensis TaxID=185542 RepID=A0ABC8T5W4_9AQUA